MKPEYDLVAQGIRRCTACSFRHPDIEPLAPALPDSTAFLMFVGENPSWADGQGVPFADSTISGRALTEHYLELLGLSRNDVWITDLFKCRYPKGFKHSSPDWERITLANAKTCSRLWLIREIEFVKPQVIVTLGNKEVYQRLRRIFELRVPTKFADAVGKPLPIIIGDFSTMLFPMIHPDISRPLGDGDHRKSIAREKWSHIHRTEHIPALKYLLREIFPRSNER